MTIHGALLARLGGYTGLTDLVSTRIYAVQMPQNAVLPCVTFQHISASRPGRAMVSDANPTEAVFQVSSWAETLDAVHDVADQVKAALDRYSGTLDSTVVQQVFRDTEQAELWDPATQTYHVPIDFRVFYEE